MWAWAHAGGGGQSVVLVERIRVCGGVEVGGRGADWKGGSAEERLQKKAVQETGRCECRAGQNVGGSQEKKCMHVCMCVCVRVCVCV